MSTLKIALSGAGGRLCSVIAKISAERDDCTVVCGVDIQKNSASPFPIYDSFDKITEEVDVIIDCSHHSVVPALLDFAVSKRIPTVICTTGHTDDEEARIFEASKTIPLLKSRNMSLGINLLSELVKKAASVLGEEYDIEILEAHHNKKLDAPSGTALMLADAAKEARDEAHLSTEYVYDRHAVREKRKSSEIGISSIRGGTIVGEHEVIFAGTDEVIKLSHSAGSRDLFAVGALRAALFLPEKAAGFYTMADVIDSIL